MKLYGRGFSLPLLAILLLRSQLLFPFSWPALRSAVLSRRDLKRSFKPILLYGILEGFIGLYSLITPRLAAFISGFYSNYYELVANNFFQSVILKATHVCNSTVASDNRNGDDASFTDSMFSRCTAP